MRNNRNFNGQMIPMNGGFGTNMMMFPNYLNDNYSNMEGRINNLEKKVKVLENRLSRLENPYQNNNNIPYQNNNNIPYQNNQFKPNAEYQTTQNNNPYDGDLYMI